MGCCGRPLVVSPTTGLKAPPAERIAPVRPGSKDSSTAGAPTYPWHWAAPTTGSPVWIRLAEWTAGGHHLLHGSGTPDLHRLEPRAPLDFSPDDYSKRTAVFATEDPTWAIAYAVKAQDCPQFLNACFYPGEWASTAADRRLFYSYARRPDSTAPVQAGTVYVLDAGAFTRQPPYLAPEIGGVITECQWISTAPVDVVDVVPVTTADLPNPVPTHDPVRVRARMAQNPAAFPWGAPDNLTGLGWE